MVTWVLAVTLIACLACVSDSRAGQNPNAKFCMHLAASSQYLNFYDFAPMATGPIDQDLSMAELAATGYYGYGLLCAYDIEGISGLEFAIEGWPIGRGAPPIPDWIWEVEEMSPPAQVLSLGDHWIGGGVSAWGFGYGACDPENPSFRDRCCTADPAFPYTCSVYPIAAFHLQLGPYAGSLPIVLNVGPSYYSYTAGAILTLDCSDEFAEDFLDAQDCFGCVIGGTWTGPRPFTEEGGPSAVEETSWSSLKALYR